MIHHHSSGKRGLWKRIFSMCIALVLICGVTVPASVSASGSADGADGVPAPETTYNFYLDGKEYTSQTVKDGETLSEPETPTAEGKTFDAWYTEMEGGEKFTDFSVQTVTETKAVFLYGRWQEADTADTENPEASEDTEIPESPETPEPGDPQEPGEGEPGQQPNQEIENGETNTENQQPDTPETDEDENTDSESDEGETAYEQRAMAVLALYGEEAAFRADEEIADEYFEISGVAPGVTVPEEFAIPAGDISESVVPVIEGYDFVNATVGEDDIEIVSLGILTIEDVTYVYYTTAGSASGLAAMVLEENETIKLNYELHRDVYDISYEITGDGGSNTVDSIFGTDRPLTVNEGGSYAFRVTIPRGYEASVFVNGQKLGVLGSEPQYEGDENTIWADGEPAELTLNGTFEVTEVGEEQQITVELDKRTQYDFSAELWTKTRYAVDENVPRAHFGEVTKNFSADVLEGGTDTWVWSFTTNEIRSDIGGTIWILDSLQINGTDLEVPYLNDNQGGRTASATTILPSGTEVTLTLRVNYTEEGEWWKPWEDYSTLSRTYTLYVSNCFENITVTGGNLNAKSWTEIMVNRLTGVEFQVYDRQEGHNTWKTLKQSEPFGVGNWNDTSKNYWFGQRELRFRLIPGYVEPTVTYGTFSGIDENDLYQYIGSVSEPDGNGWYTFSISGQGEETFTMLRIEAKIGYYDVSYNSGTYAAETEGVPVLPPYDDGKYNIVNNKQIVVSSQIPVDETNMNVFDYWTLDGYEDENGTPIPIYPNELLNLGDVAEYAVNGVLPLEAHWLDASTANQITYDIWFVLLNADGEETERSHIGTYNAPKGSTIVLDTDAEEVQEFLRNHPDYVLDEEKTQRYHASVQQGQDLLVYFTKAVTNVTIEKNVEGFLGDVQKEFAFDLSINNIKQEGFTLADGEEKVFEDVKIGDVVKFKETDAEGYDITVTYTSADTSEAQPLVPDTDGYYTITVEKDLSIIVENYKSEDPDTGIHLTTWPYVMTLAFVGAGAVAFGLYKSKRRDS